MELVSQSGRRLISVEVASKARTRAIKACRGLQARL